MISDREQLLSLLPVRFGIGVGVLFAATAVCERLGVGVGAAEVALAMLCVLAGAGLPTRVVVPLGLVAWALVTGFLVNAGGQLTFTHVDLVRAATLLAVSLATGVLTGTRQVPRTPQRGTRTSSRPGTQVIRSSRPGPIESPSS